MAKPQGGLKNRFSSHLCRFVNKSMGNLNLEILKRNFHIQTWLSILAWGDGPQEFPRRRCKVIEFIFCQLRRVGQGVGKCHGRGLGKSIGTCDGINTIQDGFQKETHSEE